MKSDIAIKKDVYLYLKGTTLAAMVTGKLSRRKRPVNSDKEDILISVLAQEGTSEQSAEVLVNVYVADVNIHGQYEENDSRLEELAEQASKDMESFYGADYYCKLNSQRILAAANGQEHVISHRLRYRIVNS